MVNLDDCVNKSDEDIIFLALENERYFACIVERYQGKLLYYICRISGVSYEEAEDVLQEVFIKIYTNLNDFDQKLKFSSWVYRIAHNQVISNHRKIKARPEGIPIDILDTNLLESFIVDFDIAKQVDISILRKKIDSILGSLSLEYREVLVLKFFEEKSYKEMSDILKKPIGTIGTLMNRAKTKFKAVYIKSAHYDT